MSQSRPIDRLCKRPPEKLKIQPDEIAVWLQRGKDMLKLGDVSAARLVLQRAAEADNAEAALLLASTFDPIELRELGVMGFPPTSVKHSRGT